MKPPQLILVLLISIAAACGTVMFLHDRMVKDSPAAVAHETAYERVMRTGEIRCSYLAYAPYLTKDSATGKLSGIWYHMTEDIGAHLGLKIVWAEEVGFGDIATSLQSGRTDAYCAGLWTAGKRVRAVDYLKPAAYEPLYAYVRADDHRFDADIRAINDPAIRISSIDGEGGGLTAAEVFPKAPQISLPQLASSADMFNQVVMNKADIVISAPAGITEFMDHNPGKLRALLSSPLKVFPVALAVKYGEADLRDMLNQAQDDLQLNGDLDRIIDENEVHPGDFWHPGKPYIAPTVSPAQ